MLIPYEGFPGTLHIEHFLLPVVAQKEGYYLHDSTHCVSNHTSTLPPIPRVTLGHYYQKWKNCHQHNLAFVSVGSRRKKALNIMDGCLRGRLLQHQEDIG